MCLLDCNIKKKNYKHFTYSEKTQIERWFNKEKKTKIEIAKLLDKDVTTVRREIKRGLTTIRDYLWRDIEVYSADISQQRYEYNKTAKGPKLKLDQDKKLVEHIESQIVNEKKSPEVIVFELEKNGFNRNICARTIRNAVKLGIIFENISPNKIIYTKEYNNKNKEKRVSSQTPADMSIEQRPKEVNERKEIGHWEGDLVVGQKKTKAVLLTLTERVSRFEIIIKLPNKETKTIAKAFDKLERKYEKEFYTIFRSITFDNGVEFQGYKGIEKSCLRKKKRIIIYYAHPYCSGERGTNENNNRLIRRWIPKGTDMTNISNKLIKEIEDWMNNYPRAMFEYKSSNMVLLDI